MFDHPVEVATGKVFSWVEKQSLAFRGLEHTRSDASAGDRAKHLEEVRHGANARMVDQIASPDSPRLPGQATPETFGAESIAKAAVLGVGLDMVYMPRMAQLVRRHAARIASRALRPTACAAPAYASAQRTRREPVKQDDAVAAAAQHFARRVLSQRERAEWAKQSPSMHVDDRLRFLATR